MLCPSYDRLHLASGLDFHHSCNSSRFQHFCKLMRELSVWVRETGKWFVTTSSKLGEHNACGDLFKVWTIKNSAASCCSFILSYALYIHQLTDCLITMARDAQEAEKGMGTS